MSITAMRQALEAWQTHVYGSDIHHKAMLVAMTNIRQALEQADEPIVGTKTWFEDGKVVTQELKYSEVYKQPADEPVIDKAAAIRIATSLGWEPKREWLGLTRDERMSIINKLAGQDWVYVVDAIEAKLKEKNT